MGNTPSAEDREMLVMFDEFLEKLETIYYNVFGRAFHEFTFRINYL